MPWQYSQFSGKLTHDGALIALCYSGRGADRNVPASQDKKMLGPIPRGCYTIAAPQNLGPRDTWEHPKLGPLVFYLIPHSDNEMHGRADFFLHGDNADHTASEGCIVPLGGRPDREKVQAIRLHDAELTVIE